jgi:hypothetical protein
VLFRMANSRGKRPPAPSVRERPEPMTLRNMRSLGPHSLDVTCKACGYRTAVNVDGWPDEELVKHFGRRMRCSRCGRLGASVRPDWRELRGVPKPPGR